MQVNNSVGSRGDYFDRNPDSQAVSYAAGAVPPHGDVTRASLTIAAGRKGFFEHAFISYYRDAAPSGAGITGTRIDFTPSGGSAQTLLRLRRSFGSVLDSAEISSSQLGVMTAGDVLSFTTHDAATEGTFNFAVSVKYVLFDA